MSNECTIEKFFSAVATGHINRVRQLHYSAKHLTKGVRISRPQLPISLNYGTVFHLAAGMGDVPMLHFLREELKRFEAARIQENEAKKATGRFWWTKNESLMTHMESCDGDGDTPLTCAILNDHVSAALALLDMGFDINRQNMDQGGGYSPLCVAVITNNETFVRLLLERGANPNIRILQKGNTLHKALENMNRDPETASRIIDLLLYFGANPHQNSGKLIQVACLVKTPKTARHERKIEFTPIDEAYGDEEDNDCRKRFRKNFKHYIHSSRCKITKVQPRYPGEISGEIVEMYSGPTPTDLAKSKKLDAISLKFSAYSNAAAASLALLKFARICLANIDANNAANLPTPVIIKIILHASNAFGKLTTEQVNGCITHARDKTTLGGTKLDFHQRNIFCFFKETIPPAEDFSLKGYGDHRKIPGASFT